MNREELIAFEADIAAEFNAGRIAAPVHLAGGNEDELIRVFKDVRNDDWICTQWRSHYHCLLKGVPPDQLKADIMAGRSITLCYPEHRIISSAIAGGHLPIALGLAWSIKRSGEGSRVWAFLGDMVSYAGIFSECVTYAEGHDLPICFVVENNGLSVCTKTDDVWGTPGPTILSPEVRWGDTMVRQYDYKLPWPHSGAGKWIQF